MNKKLILSIIILIQVVMLLFVASYAWFEGDFKDKKINNNDIVVSTSEDLVLSYRNKTYTALNVSNIVGEDFTFSQVTSSGKTDEYYKIDYTKELDGLPIEYSNAVPNTDYIEFEISLSTSSKAKRIYIDSVNSGFYQSTVDKTAANCMRCSLSFIDVSNNDRAIVLSNNEYRSDVIVSDDYNIVDGNNNPLYSNGIKETNKIVEGDDGVVASGMQNTNSFSSYDYVESNENNILFDLQPYQVKILTIRVWLEGTAVPDDEEESAKVTGQIIQFALRFASTTEMDSVHSYREVMSGSSISSCKKYLDLEGESSISPTYFSYDSAAINPVQLTTFFVYDLSLRLYRLDYPNGYNGELIYGKEGLYYDVVHEIVRIPYSLLEWKLSNTTTGLRSTNGEGPLATMVRIPGNASQPLEDYIVTVNNNAKRDEIFNIIGYYTREDGIVETVVNESCCVIGDSIINKYEVEVEIDDNFELSCSYSTSTGLYYTYTINNSNEERKEYLDSLLKNEYFQDGELTWEFINTSKTNESSVTYNCVTNIINNVANNSGSITMTVNPQAHYDTFGHNDTFNLIGSYTVGMNTYVVVNILFVVVMPTS